MTTSGSENLKNISGFRKRIAIFLILLSILSLSGLYIMVRVQDSQDIASKRFRTLLLPTSRQVQSAKTELDLQIQELSLISAFEVRSQDKNAKTPSLNPHQLTLLRLGPAVQTLFQLSGSPVLPRSMNAPFKPWSDSVRRYQENRTNFTSFQQAISRLEEIREQTSLLEKNLEREFSIQLLLLDKINEDYLFYWSLLVLAGILLSSGFAFLFWRWIRPLEMLQKSLSSQSLQQRLPLPPTSFQGEGLISPPAEIQKLAESVRIHLMSFLEQQRELLRREDKIHDNERATATLLSALFHLTRHNEELLQKVIKNEKLATMSEMSAQLAHEIRNPLNSMSLKLEVLREDMQDRDRETVDRILLEIDRLDALTESHLSHTRASLGAADIEACHLQSVVKETLEFFSDELKASAVQIQEDSASESLFLNVPRNVLKSALINILKNALEAVEGSEIKLIRVETRVVPTGEGWTLKVLDTGPGVPEILRGGRFESFVTFKKQGSGLGLATAQKMLEAYGISVKIFEAEAPYSTSIGFEGRARGLSDVTPLPLKKSTEEKTENP